MHDEYQTRASKYGLSCRSWVRGAEPSSAPQLLLVAVENCMWEDLQGHIVTLIRLGRLARVVVDEAHLLLKHEHFRPCVNMLQFLGQLPTSIVLMTATCPRAMEKALFDKLGRQIYRVLRQRTDRPEIAQKWLPVCSKDLEKTVAEKIGLLTREFQGPDRGLLFCLSHDECDRMADLLGWRPYHASVSSDKRVESMRLWITGGVMGLACTSMLNCCLDYPSVRAVFHLGPPRDPIDYYQAIGRAARNGEPALSVVYFDPNSRRKLNEDDRFGSSVVDAMLSDDHTCRRLRPAMFLDGVAVPCSMLPGAQLCDVCEAQACQPPPKSGPMCFPSDLLAAKSGSPDMGSASKDAFSSKPLRWHQHSASSLPSAPTNPLNHPAPLGTFGNHVAASQASLAPISTCDPDQTGPKIRVACQALAKSCVSCWFHGLEYHSHCLAECPRNREGTVRPEWSRLDRHLKLPVGFCFYCGCSLKVRSPLARIAAAF